ncbi:MAG: pyruvate dehydrogenase (acetyl-transferring) E1 component subunit alpha [Gammaproteobacteria bacterium]
MQTPVATFNIYYQQFLRPDGQLTQELPDFAQNPQHLLQLYKTMVFTRIFNAKAIALQRTGRLGTFPSVECEEAIGVGLGSAMETHDVFCPYYREYGAQLLRGVTPEEIFLYWGGDERGNDFKNCNDFAFCIPIGSQILHAAGVAFAMQLRKQPYCAIAAIGDGGTSEGDFYEAINVAGVWKLPLVVVVNNNQWAISVPLHKQTAAQTLAQKAIAAGFEGLQVDGDDVIAVENAVRYALAKGRRGEGPTLIEAITYRIGDHTTADDAKRYRDAAEVEQHRHEDPILRLKTYLIAQKLWDEQQEQQLRTEYQQQVAAAADRYLAIEPQPVNSMFDYLYAELPHALEEQYQMALEAEKK